MRATVDHVRYPKAALSDCCDIKLSIAGATVARVGLPRKAARRSAGCAPMSDAASDSTSGGEATETLAKLLTMLFDGALLSESRDTDSATAIFSGGPLATLLGLLMSAPNTMPGNDEFATGCDVLATRRTRDSRGGWGLLAPLLPLMISESVLPLEVSVATASIITKAFDAAPPGLRIAAPTADAAGADAPVSLLPNVDSEAIPALGAAFAAPPDGTAASHCDEIRARSWLLTMPSPFRSPAGPAVSQFDDTTARLCELTTPVWLMSPGRTLNVKLKSPPRRAVAGWVVVRCSRPLAVERIA